MKKQLAAIIIATTIFSFYTQATGLYEGEESEACFKSASDVHQENSCIAGATDKSNQQLDMLVSNINKRIKAKNLGPFDYKHPDNPDSPTNGEVYSQRFLQAQDIWESYKTELCIAVAGEIPENVLAYGNYLNQCKINLNKRHMAEIVAMGFEKDE